SAFRPSADRGSHVRLSHSQRVGALPGFADGRNPGPEGRAAEAQHVIANRLGKIPDCNSGLAERLRRGHREAAVEQIKLDCPRLANVPMFCGEEKLRAAVEAFATPSTIFSEPAPTGKPRAAHDTPAN
ncbi:MAG: hypothetical protein ABJA75_25005, partial [Bradyrhizobium sp.]